MKGSQVVLTQRGKLKEKDITQATMKSRHLRLLMRKSSIWQFDEMQLLKNFWQQEYICWNLDVFWKELHVQILFTMHFMKKFSFASVESAEIHTMQKMSQFRANAVLWYVPQTCSVSTFHLYVMCTCTPILMKEVLQILMNLDSNWKRSHGLLRSIMYVSVDA